MVVKKRVGQSSWPLLLVCVVRVVVSGRGLRSFVGLLVVVVVEQPGSWVRWIPGRGFESHRGGLESGVTARGGQVPGQTLTPQLTYPRLEGPI